MTLFESECVYSTKAATPARAATPANAVWRAPPASEEEVEVASPARLLAWETTLLRPEEAAEAPLDTALVAEDAMELTPDMPDDAAPARTVETA